MSEIESILSDCRNVHFFNGSTGAMLGGLFQNGSVTQGNFIDMLNIVLIVEAHMHPPDIPGPFTVKTKSGQPISRTGQPLTPGDYDVHVSPDNSIALSEELFVRRLPSYSFRDRETAFGIGVQARDGRCVFTGIVNPFARLGKWAGWQPAYIFPREKASHWIENDFSRWITDSGNCSAPIDSIQNGLLLQTTLHQLFYAYVISVNPDNGYKITSFIPDAFRVDGNTLDPICRDPANPSRVSDGLLRWHFRQSVLANMRGAREPSFEHDFPPGPDMLQEIREGPFPAERLEMEFLLRLRGTRSELG